MRVISALTALLATGCFPFDDGDNWATRDEIINAAEQCGLENFMPTKVGDGWAAYVRSMDPDEAIKEDCIYDNLKKQNLLVTR